MRCVLLFSFKRKSLCAGDFGTAKLLRMGIEMLGSRFVRLECV